MNDDEAQNAVEAMRAELNATIDRYLQGMSSLPPAPRSVEGFAPFPGLRFSFDGGASTVTLEVLEDPEDRAAFREKLHALVEVLQSIAAEVGPAAPLNMPIQGPAAAVRYSIPLDESPTFEQRFARLGPKVREVARLQAAATRINDAFVAVEDIPYFMLCRKLMALVGITKGELVAGTASGRPFWICTSGDPEAQIIGGFPLDRAWVYLTDLPSDERSRIDERDIVYAGWERIPTHIPDGGGRVNNCALACIGVAQDCDICLGRCPDRRLIP